MVLLLPVRKFFRTGFLFCGRDIFRDLGPEMPVLSRFCSVILSFLFFGAIIPVMAFREAWKSGLSLTHGGRKADFLSSI